MTTLARLAFSLALIFALAACEGAENSPVAPDMSGEFAAEQFAPGLNLSGGDAVQMDIQPLLQNNVMIKSRWGALRVALVGTDALDVEDVDRSSLRLEGVPAWRTWTSDCTGPLDGGTGGTDGFTPVVRINAGGPELAGSPVWQDDAHFTNSDFANIGYAAVTTEAIDMSHASIPAGTPMELFQSERYDNTGLPDMNWEVPVADGSYTVRLYFADNYPPHHRIGGRVFDISVEGQTVTTNFDIYELVGGFAGIVQEYQATVSDGSVSIDFGRVIQNPTLCGLEVLAGSSASPSGEPMGTRERDGLDDLSVVFPKGPLFQALGPVSDRDVVTLTLTGKLHDGTPFTAEDSIKIRLWSWADRR